MGMCLDITGYGIKQNGEPISSQELSEKLKEFGSTIITYIYDPDGHFTICYEGSYTGGYNLQDMFGEMSKETGCAFLLNIADFETEMINTLWMNGESKDLVRKHRKYLNINRNRVPSLDVFKEVWDMK